uniref:[RNA-polymerase]-subunit kinase n=1 Tax=Aegilops tauschii TaxID=37682 RepID=R7VZJ2_AEGTA
MGCAVSKGASLGSPGYEVSSASGHEVVSGSASASASAAVWSRPRDGEGDEDKGAARGNAVGGTARPGNLHRYIECEQIGQGTYSSVFRARSLETGRLVALKKVRFDSVEPESVRFMAREIIVLRRLQGHPNVIGLHGLITSRSSACIYLVFEYMEHDLAGLASSPDLSFSEPQVAEAFTSSEAYNSRSTREPLDAKQLKTSKKHKGKMQRVDYSGPLLSETRRVDEFLQSHEQRIRRAGRRRSWFHKGQKREQQH